MHPGPRTTGVVKPPRLKAKVKERREDCSDVLLWGLAAPLVGQAGGGGGGNPVGPLTGVLRPGARLGAVRARLGASARLDGEEGAALDHGGVVVHTVHSGGRVHEVEEGGVVHLRHLLPRPVRPHRPELAPPPRSLRHRSAGVAKVRRRPRQSHPAGLLVGPPAWRGPLGSEARCACWGRRCRRFWLFVDTVPHNCS